MIGAADSGPVYGRIERGTKGARRAKVTGDADPGIVPAVPGRLGDASVHPSSPAPARLAFYPART